MGGSGPVPARCGRSRDRAAGSAVGGRQPGGAIGPPLDAAGLRTESPAALSGAASQAVPSGARSGDRPHQVSGDRPHRVGTGARHGAPLLQHSSTPALHYSITSLLHHSTTPSPHYSITPLLHHSRFSLLWFAARRQSHSRVPAGHYWAGVSRRRRTLWPGRSQSAAKRPCATGAGTASLVLGKAARRAYFSTFLRNSSSPGLP